MTKTLVTILLFAIVISPYAYAGMGGSGGGTMGGQGGQGQMGSGMMGGQQGQGSMMMHGDMMGGIGSNMKHATDMMQRMSGVIHKDMNSSDMREMSKIMMDMSSHIKYMSEIMSRGDVSQEEMETINNHMNEMEKRFDMMKFR